MVSESVLRGVYDSQLRTAAEVADMDAVERIGPLWLGTSAVRRAGFVTYEELPSDVDLEQLVDAAIRHFEPIKYVESFEWKTRGHDNAPRLLSILEARGFVLEDDETVMLGSAESVEKVSSGVPSGFSVCQATTDADVVEAVGSAAEVFGDSPDRAHAQADELLHRMRTAPGSMEMWTVRGPDGSVACSGRVEFVPGTDVAGLWGGSCHEQYRGKGLYRALTAARARSALSKGKQYLHSDCTEFSRPILERAGLTPVTTTRPAIWTRPTP